MNDVRIITIDPAHFHAALIHKEVIPGVAPTVHIFAPLGADLTAHLNRLVGFNTRPNNPTSWQVEVHAGPSFLAQALRKPPGNVVVLAGRNRTKIDTMQACVDAGLHVLADKPWIIRPEDFPKLETLLATAAKRRVIVFDIMTERHEITSILQRELLHDADMFGTLICGTAAEPAVTMESVHALKKMVAGAPLKRPPAFFDIHQQGEGLTDVGTHLVDLVNWMIAPGEPVDQRSDVRMESAECWPTRLNRQEYREITGERDFPMEFAGCVRGDSLAYYCNNRVGYAVRGHHVRLDIRWDLELPAGDTHNAEFRGTRSRLRISQDAQTIGPPELDVVPNSPADKAVVRPLLEERIGQLARRYAGLGIVDRPEGFRIVIPATHRIGHEAHFAQVSAEFLHYLNNPQAMPTWEGPNLLTKYFITTRGVALARKE